MITKHICLLTLLNKSRKSSYRPWQKKKAKWTTKSLHGNSSRFKSNHLKIGDQVSNVIKLHVNVICYILGTYDNLQNTLIVS